MTLMTLMNSDTHGSRFGEFDRIAEQVQENNVVPHSPQHIGNTLVTGFPMLLRPASGVWRVRKKQPSQKRINFF